MYSFLVSDDVSLSYYSPVDSIISIIGVFKCIFRFENDETSPRFYDPLHPEDYCYEILSRPVVKANTE